MTQLIKEALELRGHKVINQGEEPHPEGIDAYFWGGGTLISQNGVFPNLPDKPVIGFGIGVCEAPESTFIKEQFKNIKHIFARDIYSYLWLCKHDIPCTLSFDPIFLLNVPKSEKKREYVVVNIIASPKTDYAYVKELLKKYKDEDIRGFAVGLPEDPMGCVDFNIPCTYYTNPYELVEFLQGANAVISTRLHATILSYMAGVTEINPVIYDPKLTRFKEYVMDNSLNLLYMRETLNKHIDQALL
jgi:polysaccharide pyruvyl transferase WcaK-like protein